MRQAAFYNFLVLFGTLLVWLFMGLSSRAAYDTNYFCFGAAVFVSFVVTFFIVFASIYQKSATKQAKLSTVLFLTTASPVAIFLFLELYTELIGQFFKS